jgi:hypothetical protein
MIARAPKNDRITFERGTDTQMVSSPQSYDHERSFFEQLKELYLRISHPPIKHFLENENAGYTDAAFGVKNGYLSFECGNSVENIAYSIFVMTNCRNILDSALVTASENIVRSTQIRSSFDIFYSFGIQSSSNLWFCSNCIGCEECLLCDGLMNQKYAIRWVVLSKEEYFRQKNLLLQDISQYPEYVQSVSRVLPNIATTHSTGIALTSCEFVQGGYYSTGVKYGKNIVCADATEGTMTRVMNSFSTAGSGDLYGSCSAGLQGSKYYFAVESWLGTHLYYSSQMEGCSFCFGCIGLKNVSYCILNEQYSQSDWQAAVTRILARMEQDSTLGDFLPAEMCPYPLNDTAAGMIGKYSREEAIAAGYLWRDEPLRTAIPDSAITISVHEIARYESWTTKPTGEMALTIDPEILQVVILDPQNNPYTITQLEIDILERSAVPLPRNHWQDRMRQSLDILPKDIFF